MSETTPRVRFAPSPTGYLHVGGARTALFNWLFARKTGGELLLRVEDTDAERSRPELLEGVLDSLEWLGIDFDGEPVFQSKRRDRYEEVAEKLLADGRAYWCDLTPEQVQARAKELGTTGYDGYSRDRGVERGPGTVLRFRAPDEGATAFIDLVRGEVEFPNDTIEDFVILRSNGDPMFLLANAVDDLDMGITHLIRGEDLVNTVPKILMIREALGATDRPVLAHLPLLVNEARKKLSKRRDDVAVSSYRERGVLPEAMRNYLATLGWGPKDGQEIRPIGEIIEQFDLADVNKSSAFFDVKKLEAFNGEYIRALPAGEFVERAQPWLHGEAALWPEERFDPVVFEQLAPVVQLRCPTLSAIPPLVDWAFLPGPPEDEAAWDKAMVRGRSAAEVLDGTIEAYAEVDWEAEALKDTLVAVGETLELKLRVAQAPVRVAVMGRTVGLPLFESLEVLGRDETLERLRSARTRLAESGA